ncbi:hypothetical protein [Nocardia donostiensis]|uniref:hypothetical protein n=1 Tax=Nocardia donostiensis TaxID=1538463 RepID=UPI001589753E
MARALLRPTSTINAHREAKSFLLDDDTYGKIAWPGTRGPDRGPSGCAGAWPVT